MVMHAKQISKKISLKSDFPKIYLGVGPCRSGTTAFLQVFANAGVKSWYQPIKTMLRDSVKKKLNYDFELPSTDSIFIKETIGAGTKLECTLDPLRILIEAGVPKEKIEVIGFVRDPIAVQASWNKYVKEGLSYAQLADFLAISFQTLEKIMDEAEKIGIKVNPFIYESLRDNLPLRVHERFLKGLGLPDTSTTFWNSLEHEKSIGRIIFIEQDHLYQSDGLHDKFKSSRRLKYFVRSVEEIKELVSPDLIKKHEQKGSFHIYDKFRLKAQKFLGLTIEKINLNLFK